MVDPLESRRKQGRLLLMFKLLNNIVYIPDDCKRNVVNGSAVIKKQILIFLLKNLFVTLLP